MCLAKELYHELSERKIFGANYCLSSFTLYFIMLKNGQTYFKILRCEHCKILKVCLAIFQHYEIKGKIHEYLSLLSSSIPILTTFKVLFVPLLQLRWIIVVLHRKTNGAKKEVRYRHV